MNTYTSSCVFVPCLNITRRLSTNCAIKFSSLDEPLDALDALDALDTLDTFGRDLNV